MKKIYQEYAILDADIKALEAKKVALKLRIIEAMKDAEEEKVVKEFGTFTRAHRLTYSYSGEVSKLAERLKIAKTNEEQKGVAKSRQTEYLVFSPKK